LRNDYRRRCLSRSALGVRSRHKNQRKIGFSIGLARQTHLGGQVRDEQIDLNEFGARSHPADTACVAQPARSAA
jgi:hypothetical protein